MNKLLFPILSISAAIGLWFMYIGPTYEEIQALQEQEAAFDKAFAEIRQVQNLLDELESSYASISREDLLKLEIFLPKQVDMARIMQNVGGIIGFYDLPISDMAIAREDPNTTDGPKVLRHKISFELSATYEEFLDIVRDLESNLQLARISEIELKGPAISDPNLSIASTEYEITLTYYSYE